MLLPTSTLVPLSFTAHSSFQVSSFDFRPIYQALYWIALFGRSTGNANSMDPKLIYSCCLFVSVRGSNIHPIDQAKTHISQLSLSSSPKSSNLPSSVDYVLWETPNYLHFSPLSLPLFWYTLAPFITCTTIPNSKLIYLPKSCPPTILSPHWIKSDISKSSIWSCDS